MSKVCCKKAIANNKVKVNNVVQTKESFNKIDDDEFYDVYSSFMSKNLPLVVESSINGTEMEVDTGAGRGISNMETYNAIEHKLDSLTYTNSKLGTSSGDAIKLEGMIEASFMYESQCLVVPFTVANIKCPNLLGRDVLRLLRLNWERLLNIYYVEENARTQNLLNKILPEYKEILKSEMGTVKEFEVKITVDRDCKPKFCEVRPITDAPNERTKKEVERLVEDNIYEPNRYSRWAAPIVPVLEHDGIVRICGNYKQAINQASLCAKYLVPKTEDLFASLNGEDKFSKLDLRNAY